MPKPVSNHELDALLVAAGYDRSHAAFARQVNVLGRKRMGLELRYDGASVYWWLRGRNPDSDVLPLMAAALARRLGYTVAVEDLGFSGMDGGLGVDYPGSLVEAVDAATRLWRYLVMRRHVSAGLPTAAEAWTRAGWRWLFDPSDATVARTEGDRVTAADVLVLRHFQQRFLDLDRQHGGGYARTFIAEFLHREVTPLLHGTYTDAVGRDLFGTAAELTAQLAFMAYDGGAMGLAQRAFIQALRLTKASGDRSFGAHILANMATQAVFMGRPSEAVQLSCAAVEAARRAPASVMARLHTAEACAQAVAGDAIATRRALASAESAMAHQPHDRPAWAGYFTPAHFAGTAVRCFRDLGRPKDALEYADLAMTISAGGIRTEALHAALVATVHAEHGDLDRACDLGDTALRLAEHIRSKRVEDRISTLSLVLGRHRTDSRAGELAARAGALVTTGVP